MTAFAWSRWFSKDLKSKELMRWDSPFRGPQLGRMTSLKTVDSIKSRKYIRALLSKVDNLYNEPLADERSLGEMSEHMLSGVKVKFGRDSNEYEMAGGVKRSERKRPQRKAAVMT